MPPPIHEPVTHAEPAGRGLSPGAVEAALARVLSSDPVRASRRSADFLAFAVSEVLAGRGDDLKERTIAVGALGRGARFDPRVDPSVRVQARRVRSALERYYAGPGATDPLRIELPRGRYAPVFRANDVSIRAAPRPERRGIAVISLANLTPGGDHDHLAQGLSETLVAGLSRCPECRVVGPVVAEAPGADPSLAPYAAAEFLLMGSVRARGGALRVSLRVVEAEAGETTWSRIFDRRLDVLDPFAIEDDIAATVTAVLCGHRGIAPVGVTVALPGDT